jgi:hypothetical protein
MKAIADSKPAVYAGKLKFFSGMLAYPFLRTVDSARLASLARQKDTRRATAFAMLPSDNIGYAMLTLPATNRCLEAESAHNLRERLAV